MQKKATIMRTSEPKPKRQSAAAEEVSKRLLCVLQHQQWHIVHVHMPSLVAKTHAAILLSEHLNSTRLNRYILVSHKTDRCSKVCIVWTVIDPFSGTTHQLLKCSWNRGNTLASCIAGLKGCRMTAKHSNNHVFHHCCKSRSRIIACTRMMSRC